MLESRASTRVFRRCALVFGTVSAGTLAVLVALQLMGLRTPEEVITTSAATILGAGLGTFGLYLSIRLVHRGSSSDDGQRDAR